jgi:hypothetical protein
MFLPGIPYHARNSNVERMISFLLRFTITLMEWQQVKILLVLLFHRWDSTIAVNSLSEFLYNEGRTSNYHQSYLQYSRSKQGENRDEDIRKRTRGSDILSCSNIQFDTNGQSNSWGNEVICRRVTPRSIARHSRIWHMPYFLCWANMFNAVE